jgi:tetratricopeptide (TPR) repeat protein
MNMQLNKILFSPLKKREKFFYAILSIFFFVYVFSIFHPNILVAQKIFSKGNTYFNSAGTYDLEKAAKWYRIAAFIDHESSGAHYQLARVYFVQNDLEKAKSEIDKAIKKNPEANRAFYIKGLIDGYSKNYPEAIADFGKFVEKSPTEWAGYNDLAWVYYENKDFENAKTVLEKGLEVKPDNPWLLNGLGAAYHALGEDEKAKDILEKASQLAEKLTPSEWKMAYPGNDPSSADWDLAKFKTDINFNQNLVYNKSSKEAIIKPACHGSCIYGCAMEYDTGVVYQLCNDPDHGYDAHGVGGFISYSPIWMHASPPYNSSICPYCGDGVCTSELVTQATGTYGGESCGNCPGDCGGCPVSGACGSANGGVSCDNPGDRGGTLCNSGSVSGMTSTNCGWYWTCSGSNGGSDSPRCKSFRSVPLGSCGSMPF